MGATCPAEATDCFRDGGIEAGDIGLLGMAGSFLAFVLLEVRGPLVVLDDVDLEIEAELLCLVGALLVLTGLLLPLERRESSAPSS